MAVSTRDRFVGDKLRLLRALDLFAGLSETELEDVAQTATMTRCQPGDHILSPDDPPDRIHILKHGRVRVFRLSTDGKQLTLGIYEPGTILGDMHLLGQPRLQETYAEPLEKAVICTLTRDQLRELMRRYPAIGLNVVEHLATRLVRLSASSRRWPMSASASDWRASSLSSSSGSGSRQATPR